MIEKGRKRILVYCHGTESCDRLKKTLNKRYKDRGKAEAHLFAECYHSKVPNWHNARKRIKSQFEDGDTKILLAVRCLDEGVDIPDSDSEGFWTRKILVFF